MVVSYGYSPWRVVQAWLLALLACGSFLAAVHHFAPLVLQHDRDTSVWYLNSLAGENWRQFHALPKDASLGKKRELLEQTDGYLKRARQLRPDSDYFLWLDGLVIRALARLENPPNPAREQESLTIIQQLWERPGGKTEKSARFFADYYLAHGDISQASPFIGFLLALNPRDPLAYDGLVQASIKTGDFKGALQALEKKSRAIRLTSEDHHLLAVLSLQVGDYKRAADALRTVLENGGETKERWFLFGLALLGQGETEPAQRAFGVYKYAVGETAEIPDAPSLGLKEIPSDLLPALPHCFNSARPAREGL